MSQSTEMPSINHCICCSSSNITIEPTLTSLFLSRAAWGGGPEHTELLYCNECGFRTYTRSLSINEAIQYYTNYRNSDYLINRSKDEIFYNKKKFDADEAWMASDLRLKSLLNIVELAIPKIQNLRILDYGGGDGRLIANISCQDKAIFDFSDIDPLPGIRKITDSEELHKATWDLIICAQTLEHVSTPHSLLKKLKSLISTNGFLYVELPSQQWRSYAFHGYTRKLFLAKAKNNYTFHKILDLYSTIFRVKFKILPPFGFVPMREHVNFFTLNSVIHLGQSLSLKVEQYREDPFCGIQVLFKK